MNGFEIVDEKLTDELAKNGELGLAYVVQRVKNANHEIKELKSQLVKAQGNTRKLEKQVEELAAKLDKASSWAMGAEGRIKHLESKG